MQYKHVTLVCIFDGDKVLMIKKLRGMQGFGAGVDGHGKDVFNFPGGKCETNPETGAVECFLDCACREACEETGITPIEPKQVGQLQFTWPEADKVLVCPVFRADKFSGELISCPGESEAEWIPIDAIPYDNMWPNDRIWVPYIFAGKPFHLKITFPAGGNFVVEELPLDFDIRVE